jgi:predicted signal transduction protein with EAL and GGDEF domain
MFTQKDFNQFFLLLFIAIVSTTTVANTNQALYPFKSTLVFLIVVTVLIGIGVNFYFYWNKKK